MKELIISNLTKEKFNKNATALGYWVKNEKIKFLSYHWRNKKKLNIDYKYLYKLSEEFIIFFVNKLNFIHKENRSFRYWRIILSPWLYVYISSMYDRWEIINSLNKNKNKFICKYLYYKKIFNNYGISDYIEKVTKNELWNHSNFIRIIKYKKIKKINFKNTKKALDIHGNYKQNKIFFFINFLDKILSYVSILVNSTIIENFNISKKYYLRLCLKSKIFPGLFKSFFSSRSLYKEKVNLGLRKVVFKYDSKKKNFRHFLFECLKSDFPITYLENYKTLQSEINSKGFQKKNIKKIFSMTSFIDNEIFKIWLANKVENGSKFVIVSHGGCLTPKLNGFFNYFAKIADKVITSKKSLNQKEIQMSLLKNNFFIKRNNHSKNIYIFDCEPANYACKIQSWPFINDLKQIISNTEKLINLFPKKDHKNIFYRSIDNGKNFSEIIKKRFPSINISDLNKVMFKDIQNDIKLAICMYPETVIVDLIANEIPTVIFIPNKLYSFDTNSKKMIKYLKKNKIYFDDFENLKLHLNKIKYSPIEWWSSKSNQLAVKNFRTNFFKFDKNYILKWSQLLKKI